MTVTISDAITIIACRIAIWINRSNVKAVHEYTENDTSSGKKGNGEVETHLYTLKQNERNKIKILLRSKRRCDIIQI